MKNFLLLFLSELHLNEGRPSDITYASDCEPIKAAQSNEPAVYYLRRKLAEKGETLDRIFVLATARTRERLEIRDAAGDIKEASAYEYFCSAVATSAPELADRIVKVDYDENKPVTEGVYQVTDVAKEVRECAADVRQQGEPVTIHADMTGGFRYASMLMLAVMQLLRLSNFSTGRVLYANFDPAQIEDVTGVYRAMNLISGADEFVNFGSVEEIKRYFGDLLANERDDFQSLRELITAMDDFTEAIRVCRSGQVEPVLKNLRQRIEDFRAAKLTTLEERLFSQIIDVITNEYGRLLETEADEPDIIEWCAKKRFYQQALTFWVEWLPSCIVREKIFYPIAQVTVDRCRKGAKSRNCEWENEFIIRYKPPEEENPVEKIVTVAKAWQNGKKMNIEGLVGEDFLRELQSTVKAAGSEKPNYSAAGEKILRALWEKECKNPTYKLSYEEFKRRLNEKKFLNMFVSLPQETVAKLAGVPLPKENKPPTGGLWGKRWREYEGLLAAKVAGADYDAAKTKELLKYYYWLRKERNQTNHANDEKAKSTGELMKMLDEGLKCLRALKEAAGHGTEAR